ncbi:MAG: ABC transporter permease [Acidobacteria bacterium]|nr:ABC transporter permease [Acidobacteriota bacterium]
MTVRSVLRQKGLLARIDDWMNPIVIKELRQAVQSRFVVTALLVLLSIQLLAVGIYILAWRSALIDLDAGRWVFMLLYGILLGISMLFVPLYTAIRLFAERSDTNVDLLFITTIKPRSIIAGKLFAAIILTILIFSACMPFMAFTYFLRGIDLPSIFVVLLLGFMIVITCTQAAIFVASIPVNRVLKVIFGLVVLWVFLMIFISTMGGMNELFRMGIGSRLGDWEFWEGVIGFLSLFTLLIGSFFVLSVAMITPPAANRGFPVRVFMTLAWASLGITVLIGSVINKTHTPVAVWQVVFSSTFALALFIAVSERDGPGRRVLRSVPQSKLKRAVAFFFYSGAASGLTWASVGIALTLTLAWIWSKLLPAYSNHDDLIGGLKWMGAMCLYFFCYALSGALLRRHLLSKVGSELTWIFGLILMIGGIVVPFMIGYLLFFGDEWWKEDYENWLVGNPFAWNGISSKALYLGIAVVWAVLVAALNLRWFIERVSGFRPLIAPIDQSGSSVMAQIHDANIAFEPPGRQERQDA